MTIIKQTKLEKIRSFKVLPGYVLYLENVMHEPGSVVLVGTEEALSAIMSQRWKVEEFTLKPTVPPVVVPEPVFDTTQDTEAEGDVPNGSQEKSKEEPKAKVAPKPTHSRKAR